MGLERASNPQQLLQSKYTIMVIKPTLACQFRIICSIATPISLSFLFIGTLPDGTVFDSSLGGDPVSFPLKGVIAGWREGLQRMCEGETAMLGIPPEMAYGEAGTPDGRIPGGAALFFKIQLIDVLSAGVGGGPKLVGADGKVLTKDRGGGTLLGADGKPL